jgi:hypothetical protein
LRPVGQLYCRISVFVDCPDVEANPFVHTDRRLGVGLNAILIWYTLMLLYMFCIIIIRGLVCNNFNIDCKPSVCFMYYIYNCLTLTKLPTVLSNVRCVQSTIDNLELDKLPGPLTRAYFTYSATELTSKIIVYASHTDVSTIRLLSYLDIDPCSGVWTLDLDRQVRLGTRETTS